ncbi:tetratricopeptide repeat protein [Roseofilum capinflatum]|uniref:Tetratricopeptide repeat protein n=1 Tax=Roseofilum capinflatum BLCC-M114 TaxID=3022440 RepID=A0ABT7B1P6_9CYAN|nr:hypothetical protein [Roseofilum capinflatum]MDJ1173060.1 hypothetical protein [Roseofilum capinflatum BLCC-M114]
MSYLSTKAKAWFIISLLVITVGAIATPNWGAESACLAPTTKLSNLQLQSAKSPLFTSAQLKHNCPRGEGKNPKDDLIPYIISPRRTTILNPQPLLRWNSLPSASTYTVEIFETDNAEPLWTQETNQDRVQYDGPPLLSGKTYFLVVDTPESEPSSAEETNISFEVLNPDDAAHVRERAASILNLETSETERSLLLAHLYFGYHLNAEAIAVLEALPKESKTETVYRLLGDLYNWIYLRRFAIWRYQSAAEIAEPGTAQLAAVQSRLGQIYADRAIPEKAREWLEAALATYQALGNQQRITEIQEQLDQLSMP